RVPESDAVVFAVYDDVPLGEDPPPWAELIDALCERAVACDLEVRAALHVGPDAWADVLAGTRHPLSQVPAPPVVPGVGDVSGSQHDGAALPDAPESERAAVAEALGVLVPLLDARMRAGAVAEPADPRIAAALESLDD